MTSAPKFYRESLRTAATFFGRMAASQGITVATHHLRHHCRQIQGG